MTDKISPEEEAKELVAKAIKASHDLLSDRPIQARQIAEEVLNVDPDNKDALQLISLSYHREKKFDKALEAVRKAIQADPENPDNYSNKSVCQSLLGDVEGAIESLLKALKISPKNPLYLNNLALQYRLKGKPKDAEKLLKKSLKIKEDASTLINLGGIYGELHQLEKSESNLRKAIGLEPENPMANIDLAYTLLFMGRWQEGFEQHEWRFRHYEQLIPYLQKYDKNLRWDGGKDITGKRLMVYCEQGIGDAIHFARYLKPLKEKTGADILLHCDKELIPIFSASDLPVRQYFFTPIRTMDRILAHDAHVPIMSLPHLLKLPNHWDGPYLKTKNRYAFPEEGLKIGICWGGNPTHPFDRMRSCPLKFFENLIDLPVSLYNLMRDIYPRQYRSGPPVDLAEGAGHIKLIDCSKNMNNWEETAAVLSSLDLIVTVDTAILHMAGALGLPAFGLLAYNSDWRWCLDSDRTEWYPGIRLIRQERPGDWEGVFSKLREKVLEILKT